MKPIKRPQLFVIIVIALSLVLTVATRVSGTAMSIMAPLFNTLNNDHINEYTNVKVNMGFYLPIVIHLLLIFISIKIKKYANIHSAKKYNSLVETFYYSVLLSVLFFPFYSIALTFMRFLTAFSLVAITGSSIFLSDTTESRKLCEKMSLSMIGIYWFIQIFVIKSFVKLAVIPYFDIL